MEDIKSKISAYVTRTGKWSAIAIGETKDDVLLELQRVEHKLKRKVSATVSYQRHLAHWEGKFVVDEDEEV